ncbi:MAG: hypothetical protein QXR38_04165, partial [Nitrososphaerales archaeon]
PSQAFSNEYGSLYAVYMLEGKHTLSLAVHSTKPLEINEEEYDPLEGQRGTRAKAILEAANDTLIPFFDLSATFFLTYFILPILFLLVLGLLTTGLGRALGGRGLPIPGL